MKNKQMKYLGNIKIFKILIKNKTRVKTKERRARGGEQCTCEDNIKGCTSMGVCQL